MRYSCQGIYYNYELTVFRSTIVSLFAAPTLIIAPSLFYTSMYKKIRLAMTSNMDRQNGNVSDNRSF